MVDLQAPLEDRAPPLSLKEIGQVIAGYAAAPPRPRALEVFEEFFFSRAKEVYPRYDFAPMNDDEFGAALMLD